MRAKEVVGRKITRVRQQRRHDTNGGGVAVQILGIDLDNNKHIYFSVAEQEDAADYIPCAHVARGADLDVSDAEPAEYRKTTVDKLVKACRAIEEDAKLCDAHERITITGTTMGLVQAALNSVDDENGED